MLFSIISYERAASCDLYFITLKKGEQLMSRGMSVDYIK